MALTLVGAFGAHAAIADDDLPPAPEIPSELSLAKALETFHRTGFDLLIAEASVASARGDRAIAGAVPNPDFGFTVGKTFNYNPATACGPGQSCSSVPFGFSLTDQAAIEDSLSGKRSLRVRVAEAALVASQLSRADAQRTLDFQLKQQFAQAALANEQLAFAIDVAKSSTETLNLNEVRLREGAISEADLTKFQVAKLEADQAVDTARQNVRVNLVGIAFLLGVRGPVPEFQIEAGELRKPVPPRLASADHDQMVKLGLEHRQDLLSARKQVESSQASAELAHRQRFPDITLSLNYNQEGDSNLALTPPTFTVGLSAPIPLLYQQQGEVQKSEAGLRTQQLQAGKLSAQVVSDVETAWAGFASADALVKRMESGLLSAAQRQRDLVEVQYKKGAASLLDFLDAQRTYIATNGEYLQDLENRRVAIFQLEQATGQELAP